MRTLLLAALMCSSASLAQAQITLDNSNYGAISAGDSLVWETAETAFIPTEGANQTWNYTYVKGVEVFYTERTLQPNTGIFQNATVMREALYGLGSFMVEGWVYYEGSATGWAEIGNQYKGATFPLTGGIGSLTIPDQTNTYQPKLQHLQLPITYQSTWSTNSRLEFNANLTVTPMGLDNAPAQLVQYFTYNDEVVGWGTLKMPNQNYDALLIKTTHMHVDSVFVGGMPAPDMLMAGLGLVQSDTTRITMYRFVAAGVKGGEIMVFSRSGNSSQWGAQFRRDLITTNVADEPVAGGESRVYPNPVAGNATLAFEKTSAAAWTVSVYNTTGQLVQSYSVDQPVGQVRLELTTGTAMPSGSYRYDIRNEIGTRVSNGMLVVVK